MIIYNPIQNKFPKGAVTNDENIKFEILIKDNFFFHDLKIIIKNDFTGQIISKSLTFKNNEKNNYNKYSVEFEKLETGLYFYHFEFQFDNIIAYLKNNLLNAELVHDEHSYTDWQLTVYDKNYKTPNWYKGSIMYQIFPDRFKKSDNYEATIAKNEDDRIRHIDWNTVPHSNITHKNYSAKDFLMGNLLGIEEEKNYFKQLNIESIYLNPIMESSENHRYSTADYFKIDPYFGTNEQFKQFCTNFKNDNIRIILDGVFSHTGSDSIYFNRYNHYDSIGAFNSQNSPYYDWFSFSNFPYEYNSWWGFDNLPTVIKENKNYSDFINNKDTGVLNFWQNLGISGWRLDVADEFPDEFLDRVRETTKYYDENSLIIGEVWEDATNKFSYNIRRRYFLGKQLDSVMNYPWRNAIIDFVKNGNAEKFAYEISLLVENYPKPALDSLMNLLSSHDTERVLTVLAFDEPEDVPVDERPTYKLNYEQYNKAKELLKFASFIQFTLPGVPCIYYGDEIGMYGFRDPYNRLGFTHDNKDEDLLSHYKKLSNFRYNHKEKFKSNFELVYTENNCIAYLRNNILCVINLDYEAHFIKKFSGEILFENNKSYSTPFGIVISPRSFTAIKIV
ncbi:MULTISPECIES: glycoside hydrolase family 13 protein [Gemella]|uniref:glycoside hydrolase family 13 protein n=1 Tax=Gemella TaxID=1378 RepID=UPI0007680818|nr:MULTISPECIES: glycoside hydrolase family 13 protein [Gemella]AME09415.1 amylopullulanase [Gemella sp. oral taxon 928]AXI27051.1 amylopullulanase [Gemella sp. ND 6198]